MGSHTLANACSTFGYALIPADALFTLVTYALEAAHDPEGDAAEVAQTLAAIRQTILYTEGLIAVEEQEEEAADEDDALVDAAGDALDEDGEAAGERAPARAEPASVGESGD